MWIAIFKKKNETVNIILHCGSLREESEDCDETHEFELLEYKVVFSSISMY